MPDPRPTVRNLPKLRLRGLTLATSLWGLLFWPAVALAHPSGVGELKSRASRVLATTDDWLFWDFHPSILVGIAIVALLYTLGTTTWRVRYGLSEQPDRRRTRLFWATMVLLWFTLDGPLHHLSDELLFSAHMVQHLVLQLVWAPLFMLALPAWLLRPLVRNPTVRRLAVRATRPVTAFFIFQGATWLWHWPPLYDLALEAHSWHIIEHLFFMSAACVFWWPMIGNVPEVPRPTWGVQIVYVFLNMLAMKALGMAISLQDDVLYTWYETVPRLWGMSALDDQQMGGLIMWLPGGLLLWAGVGWVFWQWANRGTPARGLTGIPALDRKRQAAAVPAPVASGVKP